MAILTYRRNDYLAELLPLLLDQVEQIGREAEARVLVVDNDPLAGAAAVVAGAAGAPRGRSGGWLSGVTRALERSRTETIHLSETWRWNS